MTKLDICKKKLSSIKRLALFASHLILYGGYALTYTMNGNKSPFLSRPPSHFGVANEISDRSLSKLDIIMVMII